MPMSPFRFPTLCLTLATIGGTSSLRAQCPLSLLPAGGAPSLDGNVRASVRWDPDGSGPQPEVLVVAGDFTTIGSIAAARIATVDPATGQWSALGSGMNAPIYALAVLPTGELVAGGEFTSAGSNPAARVARWDGANWQPLGAGIGDRVVAMAARPNGEVLVATQLTLTTPARLEAWSGASWQLLSQFNQEVRALATAPDGSVAVGGLFPAGSGLLRWNGTTLAPAWAPVVTNVNALSFAANGDLLAAGSAVARLTTTSWQWLGAASTAGAEAIVELPNGDVVVGGGFTSFGGIAAQRAARWNGSAWSAMGSGPSATAPVISLTAWPDGRVFAGGGDLTGAGFFAGWSGLEWHAVAAGFDARVDAVLAARDGSTWFGGSFRTVAGRAANRLARRSAAGWQTFGAGTNQGVLAIAELPNGDIVIGGSFVSIDGTAANRIARWNGSTWQPLGAGLNAGVRAIEVLPDGSLVAGGDFTSAGGTPAFRIARWDGSAWQALGSGLGSGFSWIGAIARMPNGDLVVGGNFTTALGAPGNYIARWDGLSWSPLGSGCNALVSSLAVRPNGDLIVGGSFNVAGGIATPAIARWNGTSWSALPGAALNNCHDLLVLPDGDLTAGCFVNQPGGGFLSQLLRWDGSTWSVLGGPFAVSPVSQGRVFAQSLAATGELVVAGDFVTVGTSPSGHWTRLQTACAPQVVATGPGCSGGGLVPVLQASGQPWLGSTFVAIGSNLPTLALGIVITGLSTTSVPVAAVLPQGLPGCNLLVSPDLIDVLLAANGTVATSLPLPDTVTLAGLVLHQQVAPFGFDALGNFVSVSTSNALQLTLGAF
jgi:trimeric autotransporter adhesin